ncbi:hypothetical protein GCM10012290_09020 [Halolactibacillus alkaliphilus]|uniref:Endolytic murein transglycosylase n=1 Tax=Halolactibacillus alkaliphilus TaxID=442899 RepID=A0A511WZD1_9BACI|nr:endolytic transglycosylase MltG [Halolactibacillus alkaliphilus]GEN56055.1 hypothetical protein HAL01_05190 [Halolactibacillus alkaliphilus]GGN67924.1 hypothetical protein GCM10012290_09020 [Halolactibacillus alkaliphilus]SFO70188.1 UPF0755 protein [Halolactibacillus alkaliphilus]
MTNEKKDNSELTNKNEINDESVSTNTFEKTKQQMRANFLVRAKEASITRKIVVVSLLVLLLLFGIGGKLVYDYITDGLSPVNEASDEQVVVDIPLGSSSSTIADILENNGIINNALIYRIYIKVNNVADFQAGEYTLSPSMTLAEVSDALQSGRVYEEALFYVTIPEGRTIEEIAGLLANNANIDEDAFLELMRDEDYIKSLIERYPSILSEVILDDDIRYPLEGYLFAATYPVYEENPKVESLVEQMLDRTEDVLLEYYGEIDELEQFSVHEIFTFSSIVEREARNEEERKLIAGVFYNRLEEGMRLETDPTVLYALGEHKDRVLFSDLEIDSPYNTYRVFGLPIGPISNFGVSSLDAVLNPTETNYLFFVAAEGNIYYSETFEEHRRKANEYLNRDI